uniref:Chloride channel CLIC-like protein 1 n=1 Tax=Steinernema glaseri TaxID=37863 RepID=A0A1I7ZSF5_9BILA
MKDAVVILQDYLVQSDLKVANLKNLTNAEYHEPIDAYWSELKHNTTPGISGSCLPVSATAEDIMELYTMMIEKGVDKCAPGGQQPESDDEFVRIYRLLFRSILEWALLTMAAVMGIPLIIIILLLPIASVVGCLEAFCGVKCGPIANSHATASTAAVAKPSPPLK